MYPIHCQTGRLPPPGPRQSDGSTPFHLLLAVRTETLICIRQSVSEASGSTCKATNSKCCHQYPCFMQRSTFPSPYCGISNSNVAPPTTCSLIQYAFHGCITRLQPVPTQVLLYYPVTNLVRIIYTVICIDRTVYPVPRCNRILKCRHIHIIAAGPPYI